MSVHPAEKRTSKEVSNSVLDTFGHPNIVFSIFFLNMHISQNFNKNYTTFCTEENIIPVPVILLFALHLIIFITGTPLSNKGVYGIK